MGQLGVMGRRTGRSWCGFGRLDFKARHGMWQGYGMDTADVLALIREVAEQVILPRYQSLEDHEVSEKRPGDLVTVADRESEEQITAALQAAFPGCVVVGEEACSVDPSVMDAVGVAEHVFVVDPVDGTRNFVHGRSNFGVMVGELRGAEVTRSWIWHPVAQRAWVSERGAGVLRDGEPMAPPVVQSPLRGASADPRDVGVHPECDLVDSKWACAVDYPTLMGGSLDFLLYRSSNPWDHVPGWLMVTELGGTIRFADGEPYGGKSRDSGLVVMAHPDVWGPVEPLVRRVLG